MERLNPGQREAVLHEDGPALVLSGAGSGKTRVLTLRIARLIGEGVPPWKIRAVTFTKKAAAEMRLRLRPLVGYERADTVRFSTFHGWGLSILRRHCTFAGLEEGFTVYDPRDCLGVLRRVDTACSNDAAYAREVYGVIVGWKGEGRRPSQVDASDGGGYADAYRRYSEVLRAYNAVDFADLICVPWHLLSSVPSICQDVQDDIAHLLVDEYQDTSPAQFSLAHWALAGHQNLFAVGDEDQAIYGWRGADIQNILRFREVFPSAVEIRLEANYRSRPEILEAANRLVGHNTERLGKTMTATRPAQPGSAVVVGARWPATPEMEFLVGTDETVWIVTSALDSGSVEPRDLAVLVRTNRQLEAVSRALSYEGVPVQLLGAKAYWERPEMQAAVALLRVTVRPGDNMAWIALFSRLKLGVGKVACEHLMDAATERKCSIWEVMCSDDVPGRSRFKIAAVAAKVTLLRDANPDASAHLLWSTLWDELNGPTLVTTTAKAEHIGHFVRHLAGLEGSWQEAGEFLDRVVTSESGAQEAEQNAVTVATIHRSKGLEWPVVLCPGWAKDLFPGRRVGADRIEEERRLAYVALTRARDQVYVLAPLQSPSCFVTESGLPERPSTGWL